MPINTEEKLLFIHIPKNAGKYICDRFNMSDFPYERRNQKNRSLLSQIAKSILILDKNQEYSRKKLRGILDVGFVTQHLTLIEMEFLGLISGDIGKYTKFTSVRSPYTRIESLFRHHINPKNWSQESFEEFSNSFPKNEKFECGHNLNSHKHLQTDFLINSKGNLNENINIIKFENIEKDLKDFEEKFYITKNRKINNQKIKIKNSSLKLSKKVIKAVNKFYLRDIELLNYKKL